MLEDNNVDVVYVPLNCTDFLQPLDLSVSKSVKDFVIEMFEFWYSHQMFQQGNLTPIKFLMYLMNPLGGQLMTDPYCYMQKHPKTIQNRFQAAGIINE